MSVETRLDKAIALGTGRTIKPPKGWEQSGFVSDNALWLKPKNRLSWQPPQTSNTRILWELNAVPLPKEVMSHLIWLLRAPREHVPIEDLQPLYPTLLRMSLKTIVSAKVLTYPEGGRLLSITYSMPSSQEFGIVHYAPTELSDLGEFEKLSYEGKQPEYGQFLDVARLTLASFTTEEYSQEDQAPISVAAKKNKQTTTLKAVPSVQLGSQGPNALPTTPLPKNRRQTAELSALTTVSHILEPGETILSIVHKRWPGLNEKDAQIKMREIYVINRILKNQVEAWNLKPGMTVFLPKE